MGAGLDEILLVALGGAAGCLARYGVGEMIPAGLGLSPTMLCNVSGCLLIGVIAALFRHYEAARWLYLLVVTGVMGGYTTYSAFALDTVLHLEAGRVAQATLYIIATLAGAVLACVAGYFATAFILRNLQPS